MQRVFKRILPHLIVISAFIAISAIYFYPALSGYQLKQGDITHFRGMSQEIVEFRRMFDEEPLWTNSMFGGMPAYQISVLYPNDILGVVDKIVTLGMAGPVKYLFLYMVGFYLLLLAFRLRPGLAAVGAVAFAFSTYFIIILQAGHNSKAHAIGYMAPILAGIIWAYRGKIFRGTALAALAVALQVHANHVQITYYFGFLILCVVVAKGVAAVRRDQLPGFIRASLFLLAAGVIGVLANANVLWNTWSYGQETTRGPSNLTIQQDGSSNAHNTTEGLDRDYVTQWSYGLGETFSFLVPNVYGGASGALIDANTQKTDPQLYNTLARGYQATQVFPNTYWGEQPFTSGPVYVGALIVLLFVLGAVFIRSPLKWALIATAILTIMLSWGHNFMGLTNFFLDYIPGYNKFRAVTIILAITELVFPLLGFLFLRKLFLDRSLILRERKKFLIVSGIVAGILVLFLAIPTAFFNFLSSNESASFNAALSGDTGAVILDYANALKAERISLFRADTFRSLVIVLIGIALLWGFAKRKLNPGIFIGALALVVLIDLWSVDKRYLNNEKDRGRYVQWEPKEEAKAAYSATAADLAILEKETSQNPHVKDEIGASVTEYLKQKKAESTKRPSSDEVNDVKFAALRFNTDYRVLPISGTFQDARTAYFHNSIGGYHGAKLKRIQELYDFQIAPEISRIVNALQDNPTVDKINGVLRTTNVLNMLNTKYIIYNTDAPPIENPYRLGSAWFVQDINIMDSEDDDILALGKIDPEFEATVNEKYADMVSGFSYSDAADAQIVVDTHLPNYIKYIYESPVPQATIFSEIYYKDGWHAYIDGKPADYFRADYILRGMIIPAGSHTIEFKFEPRTVATANTVSTIFSVIVILLLIFGLWKGRSEEDPHAPQPELGEMNPTT